MASILDRYGIKEVCDFTFYELDENGIPMYPVLYLDTLKVSTMEQTAEEATATGGIGNGTLISWDHTKDITVTLEDALFSPKSMAVMFGNGRVSPYGDITKIGVPETPNQGLIMKTEVFTCLKDINESNTDTKTTISQALTDKYQFGWDYNYKAPDGRLYEKINPKFYEDDLDAQVRTLAHDLEHLDKGRKYFCTYDLRVAGSVIEVSAHSFPGTYYAVGETYARSFDSGKDEFFQLIFPKVKVTSENTITMEADGDPTVFNMNLHVLRAGDGSMMKLVKYALADPAIDPTAEDQSKIYHNHYLANQVLTDAVEDSKTPAKAVNAASRVRRTSNSFGAPVAQPPQKKGLS